MNKLSIGDRVRFLNTVGGGTVKGFLNKQLVMVEDEHGFDVPVLISECVVVETAGNEKMGQAAEKVALVAKEGIPQETTEAKVTVTDVPEETLEGEMITACLAFLPSDAKNLSTTGYECYFVNDSNYRLLLNYMSLENNRWRSRYSGSVEPNTKIFLEEFGKDQLNELEKVSVQFIAFKHHKPFRFKNPCSVELRIDTVKFYKLHSFRENDYFEEDALLFYIMRSDQPERELVASVGELEKAIRERVTPARRPRIHPTEKKEKNELIEIDLHIDQLLDTTAGMNNADVLEYQLQKFHEVMSDNRRNKNRKIVFIHGKGDGVLKNAIMNELKKRYPSCHHQDASFQEYGYGATMVTIK